VFDKIVSVYFILKIYILALEMANSGNQHCACYIGTQSFPSGPLWTLPASSSDGMVSVCLSRRLTAAAMCSWFSATQARAADIDVYLTPAPGRSS